MRVWGLLAAVTALRTAEDAVMRVQERLRAHDSMKAGTSKLYDMEVNLDIENMDPNAGVTVYFDRMHHSLRLDTGLGSKEGLAWGTFSDNIDTTGWSELRVSGSPLLDVGNSVKMYSAGFVEGILSCIRISQYYHNTHQLLLTSEASHHSLLAVRSQLQSQVGFIKASVNLVEHIWPEEPGDVRFRHARFLLFQLWGLMDGYNYAAKHFKVHPLSLVDFFLLNSMGEAGTLMDAYRPQTVADRAQANSVPLVFLQKNSSKSNQLVRKEATQEEEREWRKRVVGQGRCSAVVRLTEGNGDLIVGHTTWADYSTMTRVFKYYSIPLPNSESMLTTVAMSSYPGTITSGDNYFMSDSGIVLTDTSLEMVNPFGFDAVKDFPVHAHLPNFMHVVITLRLAKNAADFAKRYQVQNTGTLMAQWMVVDYNMFEVGKPPGQNMLWIIEQIPGQMEAKDMSLHLRTKGYWESVNRPFFQSIRETSWFDKAQKSHGALYSATDCPRCRIIADNAPGTNTLYDMRNLIHRNNFPIQAYRPFQPGHEISARFDLDSAEPIPNGGIDSKIVNRCMFKLMTTQAISGPSHAMLPNFAWVGADGREKFPGNPHNGMPNVWSFNWQQISPAGSTGALVDLDSC